MKAKYYLILTLLVLLSGCSQVQTENPVSNKPALREDYIVEEFDLPYAKEYIFERWKVLRQSANNSNKIVRSTSNWVPGSYGPMGYEDASLTENSVIYRSYQPADGKFNYCVKECQITIKLSSQVRNKTHVKITYLNEDGKAAPFAEEMQGGLKYYLSKNPVN